LVFCVVLLAQQSEFSMFELLNNLRSAKQIGLTISPNVLARADRVIGMKTGIRHEAAGNSKRVQIVELLLCALLLGLSGSADAQPQAKIPTIGWLDARPPSAGGGRELFAREFRAVGYVDGKTIAFEFRSADNKLERLPSLADELIRLRVNVLFTPGGDEALAAKKMTTTIPIVFAVVPDPVALGLVNGLARPGGNVTGLSTIAPMLAGKRLELLKETIPRFSRVAVLWDPKSSASAQSWKESQLAARELGVELHSTEVSNADRFDGAFQDAIKAGSVALAVIMSPLVNTNQKRIADLALKHRLPAIYPREDFADSGGLMSYGPDRAEPYKRAATYVDKILKGAKPADLPVEQPTKFELVINLNTAKQIGLTIPPNVLARADRVIR
jgi:putative ABC transport system substrate-binding protein